MTRPRNHIAAIEALVIAGKKDYATGAGLKTPSSD